MKEFFLSNMICLKCKLCRILHICWFLDLFYRLIHKKWCLKNKNKIYLFKAIHVRFCCTNTQFWVELEMSTPTFHFQMKWNIFFLALDARYTRKSLFIHKRSWKCSKLFIAFPWMARHFPLHQNLELLLDSSGNLGLCS